MRMLRCPADLRATSIPDRPAPSLIFQCVEVPHLECSVARRELPVACVEVESAEWVDR